MRKKKIEMAIMLAAYFGTLAKAQLETKAEVDFKTRQRWEKNLIGASRELSKALVEMRKK